MKTILLLTLLLSSFTVLCQKQITGIIKSEETQATLPYASILIKGTNIGCLSDEAGIFELSIPKKHLQDSILVSYIGYHTKSVAINQKEFTVSLEPANNSIEKIVITPIDADSIIQAARKQYVNNHIKHSTKQAGFMRARFLRGETVFQVSETSYDVYYEKTESGAKRFVSPIKSRMLIDSAEYKAMNDVFHFKRDTFLVEPVVFISAGQSFNSDITESKSDKKWTEVYEYIGKTNYQNHEAYEIKMDLYRKKIKFVEATYLIDVETLAFLSIEYSSDNEEEMKKLVPFAARVALGILGYKFSIQKIKRRTYYRYNGEFFELDKGMLYLAGGVARGGDWIHGSMIQEYYLQDQTVVNKIPKEPAKLTTQVVDQFSDDYFSGQFHLPTTEKNRTLLNKLQQRNAHFSGEIYSEKHKKWLKKQERKRD